MSTEPRPLPATYAAIVFKGVDLEPELISAMLEAPPTLSYRRGDRYIIKDKPAERKFGLWVYSTRNMLNSTSLEEHLAALERILIGDVSLSPSRSLEKIQDLTKDCSITFRIDIFWYGRAGAKLPEVSRSFQYVVSAARGTIEMDLHRDDESTIAA
ncbi:DUF4279 domain-containing protein [Methylobacterium iners]|uniref:DUF4279 domain-containing protein n=1 Tax=Methylobacterium iners TaxID=418707 RepID=UPI001EE288EE|nr:DUF4279 domain-containing protein [Methylobacterium iners]